MSYWLRASDSNRRLRRVSLVGTSYSGPMVISTSRETLANIVFSLWKMTNDRAQDQLAKWGQLLYNTVDCTWEDFLAGEPHWESGAAPEDGVKEHWFYLHSPRGNVLMRRVKCTRAGGQAVQIVYRDPESDTPLGWQHVGTHRFEDFVAWECGLPSFGAGRASFALSLFGRQEGDGSSARLPWGCPVELENPIFEHDSKGAYTLRGALLCELRPYLRVIGGRTRYVGAADRDIWECKAVPGTGAFAHIDAHDFHAQRKVDFNGFDHVRLTGCGGPGADVWCDGRKIGRTTDSIDWQR